MLERQEASCSVAIIGAGNMAREHVRAFRDVPGCRVAGIQSRTRARAESLAAEFGIPLVCDTVAELHHQTAADLVVITVSEWNIADVTQQCLEYPWVVLMEKPPGISVASAEGLLQEAESTGRDVRVALNRQWLSVTQAVLGDLQEADGARFVKVQDQQSYAAALASGKPQEAIRGWMYTYCIHNLDYFRLFARGTVERIEQILPWDPERPGVVLTRISFSSGDEGLYEAIWHAPGPWAVSVTVPGKRWELRPLEQGVSQEPRQAAVPLPVSAEDTIFKPGFRRQAEEAVAVARGGASALPTVGEALRTMRLIKSIYGL